MDTALENSTLGTILLVGASRGIGAAVAAHLAPKARALISVSRTPAAHGRWVAADVATDEGLDRVVAAIGTTPLDALLYLGGVWEDGAFTHAYRFEASPRAEIRRVIAVNLIAPILLVQALAPNLRRSPSPRVLAIGMLGARVGEIGPEVANGASKLGLLGAARAMRHALAADGIAIGVLNPGNVATAEVLDDIAAGRFRPQEAIPMADLVAAIDFALACSPLAFPTEIDLAQTRSAATS